MPEVKIIDRTERGRDNKDTMGKIVSVLTEEVIQKEKKEQAIGTIALIGILALLMIALSDE